MFRFVVIDQDETGLATVPEVVLLTIDILGLLTDEAKVNREALKFVDGSASNAGAASLVTHFGSKAYGALLKDRISQCELGGAIGILMGIDKLVIGAVTKALVPEHLFHQRGELVNATRGQGAGDINQIGEVRWVVKGTGVEKGLGEAEHSHCSAVDDDG